MMQKENFLGHSSSVIRQKGESQDGCFKETKHVRIRGSEMFVFRKIGVHVSIKESEMFVFRKIWRALFSWNTRFEIRSFALLPTS